MKHISTFFLVLASFFNALSQSVTITPTSQGEMIRIDAVEPYQNVDILPNFTGGIQFRNRNDQSIHAGLWYKGSDQSLNISSSPGLTGLTYSKNSNLVGIGTYSPLAKLGIESNTALNPHLALIGGNTEMRFTNNTGTSFWNIRATNNGSSNDYFEIRRNNGFPILSISGNSNLGIGLGPNQIDEKLHISGNLKVDGNDPIIKLKASNSVPGQQIQFLKNTNSVIGGLKSTSSGLQLFYGSTDGIIVNNTVGIGGFPTSQAALLVSGNDNFINGNATLKVNSSGKNLSLDGKSINTDSKLLINDLSSQHIQIGANSSSASESQEIDLRAYTSLGGGPAIKSKRLTQNIGGTEISIPMAIGFNRIVSISVFIRDSANNKLYLPNNSDPDFTYNVIYDNTSVVLQNLGTSLQGKTASVFIMYEKI